ncbi:MAG: hypothetical protein HQL56_06705 [Magnetococcales bacterium]|nr:hypothetical protein [Magnetococcales bacterium]
MPRPAPLDTWRLAVPQEAEGLRVEPLIRFAGQEGETVAFQHFHFDTEQRHLALAGLSLTVLQETGQPLRQRLSRVGSAPFRHGRNGFEEVLLQPVPDLGRLLQGRLKHAIPGHQPALTPVLVVSGERTTWQLELPEKGILLVREERGHWKSGETTHPFRDVVIQRNSASKARMHQLLSSLILTWKASCSPGFPETILMPHPPEEPIWSPPSGDHPLSRLLTRLFRDGLSALLRRLPLTQWKAASVAAHTVVEMREILHALHGIVSAFERGAPSRVAQETLTLLNEALNTLAMVWELTHVVELSLEPLASRTPEMTATALLEEGRLRLHREMNRVIPYLSGPSFSTLLLGLAHWSWLQPWRWRAENEHLLYLSQNGALWLKAQKALQRQRIEQSLREPFPGDYREALHPFFETSQSWHELLFPSPGDQAFRSRWCRHLRAREVWAASQRFKSSVSLPASVYLLEGWLAAEGHRLAAEQTLLGREWATLKELP